MSARPKSKRTSIVKYRALKRRAPKKYGLVYALITAAYFIGVGWWIQALWGPNHYGLFVATLPVWGVGVALFLVGLLTRIINESYDSPFKDAQMGKFLEDNGWQRLPHEQAEICIPTQLLTVGDDGKVVYSFCGEYQGQDFKAVIYSYSVSIGNTTYTRRQFVIQYSSSLGLPYISIAANGFTDSADSELDVLQLEGDFSDTYTVSIVRGTQVNALAFLTPDFMGELLVANKDQSYEFEGTDIRISRLLEGDITDYPKYMQEVFDSVPVVARQLNDIRDSWMAASSDKEHKHTLQLAAKPRKAMKTAAAKGEWDVYGAGGIVHGGGPE